MVSLKLFDIFQIMYNFQQCLPQPYRFSTSTVIGKMTPEAVCEKKQKNAKPPQNPQSIEYV